MKIHELREMLKDKRVIEEINKHLWIESQKVGYSIGISRATEEWLRLYASGWLKHNTLKNATKKNEIGFKGKKIANKKKEVNKKEVRGKK